MPSAQHPIWDVAVVGGGVIGLSVAWAARRRGLSVVVLERDRGDDEPRGAWHVAAGMLAPTSEAARGESALLALGLESAARYRAWCAEIAEAGGRDPGLRRCGALMVARDRDEAEWLERELAFRSSAGLDVARLRPSEARALEPALAPALRLALHARDDHAVDPRRLVLALHAAASAAGVEVRRGFDATELLLDAGRVVGVAAARGERVTAERVVVAAGAWSAGIRGVPAEARVPVRPVRGQIMRLRDPAGAGLLSRVLRLADGYVVPRGEGSYVLGATVEERGWDVRPTAGGVFELLRSARELLPGVDEWILEELAAGLRPGTPDNAPAMGAGALDGLFWATGHHRNGILLAPVTGEALAAALLEEPVDELLAPFAPQRFTSAAVPA